MTNSILREIREKLPEYLRSVQSEISDEFRAFNGDSEPGIQVTIATDGKDYASQTGDNSYFGSAYLFPHWAVVGIYRDSDIAELTDEIISQLDDLLAD